jgi:phosphoribosylpyrophosphate synthetase
LAEDFSIFCGNASRRLGDAIARTMGVPIGAAAIERFPDGEVSVEIRDTVRRKNVFIVQSTAPPVNDHLMELLAFADASRRASAAQTLPSSHILGIRDRTDGMENGSRSARGWWPTCSRPRASIM